MLLPEKIVKCRKFFAPGAPFDETRAWEVPRRPRAPDLEGESRFHHEITMK